MTDTSTDDQTTETIDEPDNASSPNTGTPSTGTPSTDTPTGDSPAGVSSAEPEQTVNPDDLSETVPVESDQAGESGAATGDDSSGSGPSNGADRGSDQGRESTDPLDLEGEIAADYLEELLDIADLDGDIDTYVESGRAHVSIVTEADVLVGQNGKVLDALQELARLAVVTETGHRSRLMLDVAGHRDQRRTELVSLATDSIEEARTSKESVRLAPMNAFERKIVHDAVAAAGLTSESEGEEPQRRVVIIP